MKKTIFVSGPHGSGKTTLISKLLNRDMFIENNFDINFIKECENFPNLNNFEKCLVRLYHRIYLTSYARSYSNDNPDKTIITSRGLFDSLAYINSYQKMGWITKDQAQKMKYILGHPDNEPNTIILNPKFEVIRERLNARIELGSRKNRDRIFSYEDTEEFVSILHDEFVKMRTLPNVIYLEDNCEREISQIIDWVNQ